jgi:Flp pilus assembly protein TadD
VRACNLAAATFLDRDGDGRSALDFCDEACRAEPDSPSAFRALLRRGDILKRAGDPDGAREALEQARQHAACTPPWPQTIDEKLAGLS